jgi:hypothetical protein
MRASHRRLKCTTGTRDTSKRPWPGNFDQGQGPFGPVNDGGHVQA